MSASRLRARASSRATSPDAGSSLDHLLLQKRSPLAVKPMLGFGPGQGLFVDLSTIANAGHGLFSDVLFVPGDIITLYDGIAVHNIHANFASKDNGDLSHACKVKGTEYLVLGLRYVIQRRGLGSFANHSNANNAVIATKNIPVRYFNQHSCPFLRRCIVIKAIAPIFPGDEIFVRYSRSTLARLSIPQS